MVRIESWPDVCRSPKSGQFLMRIRAFLVIDNLEKWVGHIINLERTLKILELILTWKHRFLLENVTMNLETHTHDYISKLILMFLS